MKKYVLLVLFANILLAEDLEVNKEVQGVNQKKYTETREIDTKGTKIIPVKVKLVEINEEKVTPELKDKTPAKVVTDTKVETALVEEKAENLDDLVTKSERESKVFFGIGGNSEVTNYNYGIVDNAHLENLNLDYNLYLKRDSSKENRDNTTSSSDQFNILIKKEKLQLGLNVKKGTLELPGMVNATSLVKSDKSYLTFGTDASYALTEDVSINLKANYDDTNSDSLVGTAYTRSYNYSDVELNGDKEFLFKDANGSHNIDATMGIIVESIDSDTKNILYVEGKDRFNFVKLPDYSFDGTVKIEGANKTSLSASLDATKKIDETIDITAGLAVKNNYKLKKDLINDFYYVNDIIDFTTLNNEKIFSVSGAMTYIKDKTYLNAEASINNASNKISYEAVEVDLGRERAITVKNYDKNISWVEVNFNGTYTQDDSLRGEVKVKLSTLTDLAFVPAFQTSVEGIYTQNKYEGKLRYAVNGAMFTKNKGALDREGIDAYGSLDLMNKYSFSTDYSINFGIENLFDSGAEKMKGYPINGRLITLGAEIKY